MGKINYETSARYFKVFSHPTRLLIVAQLLKGKRCVSGINEIIKARQPNISQHLAILKANGIVKSKQKGKEVCYCLRKAELIGNLFDFLKNNGLI